MFRVIVVGSNDWSNYSDVMRNMTILLEDLKYENEENNKITVVHAGNKGAENMISEYIGKVEKFLRQKGFYIKEEIFKSPNASNKSTNDYNMIQDGADYAIVFSTKNDKRAAYCTKILQEFDIPTKVILD